MENKNLDVPAIKKVAIVTGSATGIGYETAIHLARNGYRTYATMRNLQKSKQIKQIARSHLLPLHVIQLDVTDSESVDEAIATIINESGRIDVLVNNAGYGLMGSVEDVSEDELKSQFETNVFGAFRVTRAVLPHMRKQKSGLIINISSVAGRVGLPLYSAYASTKFALEGLSESMAFELQPFGIKVAIIEPGFVKTSFRREKAALATQGSPYFSMTQSTSERMEGMVRQDPADVAKAVIHSIDNPKPQLRYPVGKEAEGFIEGTKKLAHTDNDIIIKPYNGGRTAV